MKEADLQAWAFADLANALIIRAVSDARIEDGTLLQDARAFLFGETPEWLESKRFWLRMAGISEQWFDEMVLSKIGK